MVFPRSRKFIRPPARRARSAHWPLEANVVIDHAVIVGSHVRIGAGSVIGAAGFQPARLGHEVLQMAHGGGVKIEDHVEIFANAAIARGVFRQSTTIGEYARVGNGAFVSQRSGWEANFHRS